MRASASAGSPRPGLARRRAPWPCAALLLATLLPTALLPTALLPTALLPTALLVAALPGQSETLRLPAFTGQRAEDHVVLDVAAAVATHARHGPVGFVTCALENPDTESREVVLRISSWSEKVLVRDSLQLEPRQRVTRHYPVQRYGQALAVVGRCASGPEVRSGTAGGTSHAWAALLVTPRAEAEGQLQSALSLVFGGPAPPPPVRAGRPAPPSAAASTVGVTGVRPQALPDSWQCFAGFDLLAVDARGALAPASEQALVDAVACGAPLVVLFAESLGDGPLRRTFAGAPEGRHGFGRFLVQPGAPAAGTLEPWLRGRAGTRFTSGPADDWLHAALKIPGLAEVPVMAFFALLTLFVVVAGPVNIFLCRRAGRPLLVAFTLPVLGFGFAGAILLWGVFAEGLGVRGVVRSLTWLDQRAHVAVNHAGATLYSGLTPAALVAQAGTLPMSLAVKDEWRDDTPHRLVVDHAQGGRYAGNLLPARWQTALVTVTHKRMRERVRFRRAEGGHLEALAGPGLVPAAPGIAMRDLAGEYWLGAPQGDRLTMQRADAGDVRVFLREAREGVMNVPVAMNEHELRYAAGGRPPPRPGKPRETMDLALHEMLRDLEPGTFVAWVADNAAFDTLGLQVAWEGTHHLVLGVLAAEDFVD